MSDRRLTLDDVVAIDCHAHVELGMDGGDHLSPELRSALSRYFRGVPELPTAQQLADYYRDLNMMAVVFTVDSSLTTGQPRIPNAEVMATAAANEDVLIPFASIDPRRGADGLAEAKELVAEGAVRGFKFHPNIQQFWPNDREVYPLYEVINDAGLIALFHTGHSGVGAGLPGGGGMRLKYSNPMAVDDVAVDFPELKIVLAHPSFPWQDEALSIAMHKPQVSIDLSGWSPRRLPSELVRYAGGILKEQMLFGSDYPLISPEKWLRDFDELDIDGEAKRLIIKGNAVRLFELEMSP